LSGTDAFRSAVPIALTGGRPQTGLISPTPTYYGFTVTELGRLTAEVAPSGGATRLTLLDATGRVLVQSDGQSATNRHDLIDLHLAGSPAGMTYYLEVQGLGNAAGTYSLQTNFTTATPPFQTLPVGNNSWGRAVDLNGDGTPDLVTANYTTGDLSVLLGRGDGTFAPEVSYPVGVSVNDVVAADLRGRGVLDLVAVSPLSGTVSILQGNGDGTFAAPTQIALGGTPNSVVAGDFGRDGHVDLAVTDFVAGDVAVLSGNGDGTFAAPTYYAVGSAPTRLIAADFNHDGILDLATANSHDNTVSVLMGNGDGTFQPQRTFAVGKAPYSLVAGDFRGDGRLDIATANTGSDDVSILLGNGDGAFAAATSLPAGAGTTGIVAANFGGGCLDLAVTNQTAGTLSVFRGHGDGTFDPQTTLDVGSTPAFIAAADFNHDGRIDLAHGDESGHVFIDLGRGDGTFQILPATDRAAGDSDVKTADLNGDGRLDMVTVNNNTNDVQVFLGRDDGTFQIGGRYPTGGSNPSAVAIGDFNHDGTPDLAVTNFAGGVSILLGRGDGTFSPPTTFAAGNAPSDVVVGDFNGDGNLDLAVANIADNTVSVLLGNGDGTFSAPHNYAVDNGPFVLVAADLTGNGILDLATANIEGNDVSVLFGRGDGTFGNVIQLPDGHVPTAIVAGDFTGNHIPDLAVTNNDSVSVFLGLADSHGKPSGAFAPQVTYAAGSSPSGLAVGDFNRDGYLDLATAGADHTLTVLFNQGDGTFQARAVGNVGDYPQVVRAGDFTGTGVLDLVTANVSSNDVSVLLGNGDGTFRTQVRTPVPDGPLAIGQADLTGSGHADLVTANFDAGTVSVRLGEGDGTFRDPVNFPVGNGPDALATGDFNGDGRADLAVANSLDGTVSILFGIGDGTFTSQQTYAVGKYPDAIVVGDFNGDGTPDLAVANYGSGTVSILLGHRDGTFQSPITITVGAGPKALALGDFNGDGTPDLVVADALSRDVTVLRGNGDGTFRALAPIALGVGPVSVVTGNFTGNGTLDIAVVCQATGDVFLLKGRGHGTFAAPSRVAKLTAPIALVTGDFTGNGRPDLAIADNATNTVSVLLGQGDGTFQEQTPFGVGGYAFALVAGDFNGDGRLDLATVNGLTEAVSVGLGLGDGTFSPASLVSTPMRSTPLVADLTGNGVPDVAVLRGDGAILVRFGVPGAPGTFGPPVIVNGEPGGKAREVTLTTYAGHKYLVAISAQGDTGMFYRYIPGIGFTRVLTLPSTGILSNRFAVADLDGYGLLDGVVSDVASGQLLIIRQQEYFAGIPPQRLDVGPSPSDIAFVDLEGNHRLDIVVTDKYTGDVRVFFNDPAAPFVRQARYRSGTGLTSLQLMDNTLVPHSLDAPVAVVGGNFTGGPGMDLVVVNNGANSFSLLRNDGLGGLLNPVTFATGSRPIAVVAGRFTAGPNLDLAILNQGCADISIFLGDGHGGFRLATKIRVGNNPTGLAVADVNGNGKLDLLVGNAEGDVLTLLGNGNGTFQPYQRIDRHVALAVAQVGDGQPELVFADQSQDRVMVQYDEPGQNWQQGRQNGVLSPNAVKLADLNGDGIPDLIVANGGGNDVLVYPGLGDGQFGPAQHFFVGTDPVGITVADLNGDGIPDLIVANKGSNDLSILYGQGHGSGWTLTQGPRLHAGLGPVATVVQDFDEDGVPDILVANSESNNVYWLRGVGGGFFNDMTPAVFPTGRDPEQLFVGHFAGQSSLDLVTVNAGSNDLTFFPGFGPGRSLSLGGVDPVAALAGDFNHDGTSDLIVAGRDGQFMLLLSSANGPRIASAVTPPGLMDISDIALGGMNGNVLEVYATTEGAETASLVSFVLQQPPATPVDDVPSSPVAEFSSLSASRLEIVVTLLFGPRSSLPAEETAQPVPDVGSVGSGEAEDDGAAEMLVTEADEAAGASDRNALITGTSETSIRQHLSHSAAAEQPTVAVPFSSAVELLDAGGKGTANGNGHPTVEEGRRWIIGTDTSAGPASSDPLPVPPASSDVAEPSLESDAPASDGLGLGTPRPSMPALPEQRWAENAGAMPMFDEQAAGPNWSRRRLGRFLALALSLVAPFLVQERSACPPREDQATPRRRTR
jgi:hypothetical protein